MKQFKIILPMQLLAGSIALLFFSYEPEFIADITSSGYERIGRFIIPAAEVMAWFASGAMFIGLIELLMWHRYEKRTGLPIPRLLNNIIASLVYIVVSLIIVANVFNIAITSLIAGSSIMAAVIGLAITKMIADVFSGGALSIERSYTIGDWLDLEMNRRQGGRVVGRVVEINWRATHLHTLNDELVIVPNSQMASASLINMSLPARHYCVEIPVSLSHTIPADRVRRIIMSAIKLTKGVVSDPEPMVRLLKFDPHGMQWAARIWIEDYSQHLIVTEALNENILNHLHISGVDVLYNPTEHYYITDRNLEPGKRPIKEELIHHVRFMEFFDRKHLAAIQNDMHERCFAAGAAIIFQGDEGSSMFIVAEGLVSINVRGEGGDEKFVSYIEPGQYFGEMSLLTGQPRSASAVAATEVVCYEIKKAAIEPVLREAPHLIERISSLMDERQQGLERACQFESDVTEKKGISGLYEGMLRFFGIAG